LQFKAYETENQQISHGKNVIWKYGKPGIKTISMGVPIKIIKQYNYYNTVLIKIIQE